MIRSSTVSLGPRPPPSAPSPSLSFFLPLFFVFKLGARGSFVYDARTANGFLVPAYPSTVVDATGAGDAYCGGFMAGLHLSGDPATAALYAAVSASFAIEAHGALAGLHAARTAALGRVDWLRGQGHEWNGRPQDAAAQPEVNPDAVSLRDGGCSGNSGHHSRAGIPEVNRD